jgi:MutS domain V
VTLADVSLQYQQRFREVQSGLARARGRNAAAGVVLAAVVAVILWLAWPVLKGQAPFWRPLLAVPLAIPPVRFYRRYHDEADRLCRVQRFTERALERIDGDWAGSGNSGQEFLDTRHPYAHDLNVFGEGSLFERLSIARTGVGRRGLARYLTQAASIEEIRERQEAVRELAAETELREAVAGLGPFESSQAQWETFTRWLDSPPIAFPPVLRAVLPFTAAAVAALVIGGLVGVLPWITVARGLFPLLAFHAAVGLRFRRQVLGSMERLHLLSAEIQVVREGLELLGSRAFQSARLRRISAEARAGSGSVRKLERLLNALSQRTKEWFYLPFLILAGGTQLSMAIEHWRELHGGALREWLAAWADFEALNALACFAYENPGYSFPEVSEGDPHFEARAAGHPLLPHDGCVLNELDLNRETRCYIISGSNMSGKSTLLRTIGLNAVLALAGAPARASSLRLSRFSVCASLAPPESLAGGKSRFLAEVQRLKQGIELTAGDAPVLFLVDEIFSGTNSSDRRVAAEAVVRTLIDRGAVGALSTHDLALAEIADREGLHGRNVHMGSRPGGSPLDFDYLLKPGVTTEANALAIARMAGVSV